ncbi:hypothetical protein SVA_0206 [Sulfurifustis variabilis]|uniref:Uncharacterized protein n=1 Tax=Sulfurifustis variabilis TaxID=1675686 RepID=A0A1B4V040_9GAMM|nr:hypothetical protein [Sulfurifustis variabilis]BAU46788.1 hypothetical protein SVA_0206 [Sulfurifustis variabilis]
MAACPKCGITLDWWKVLRLDRTAALLSCERCGTLLKLDPRRVTELMGLFAIALFLPATNLFPFEWGIPWIVAVGLVFTLVWVALSRFQIVGENELAVTPEQEQRFRRYAVKRRRLNVAGHALLWGGLLLAFSHFYSPPEPGELLSVLGMAAAIVGMVLLLTTRCPYCLSITVKTTPWGPARCINCNRELNVD